MTFLRFHWKTLSVIGQVPTRRPFPYPYRYLYLQPTDVHSISPDGDSVPRTGGTGRLLGGNGFKK